MTLHVTLFRSFCYAEVALPEPLEEPHHAASSQLPKGIFSEETCDLHAASRASGNMKHKVQFSVSVVYLCAYGNTLNLIYSYHACMSTASCSTGICTIMKYSLQH